MKTHLKIAFVLAASSLLMACVIVSTPTIVPTETSTSQETAMPIASLVIPDRLATNTLTGIVPAFTSPVEGELSIPEHVHVLLECEPYNSCTIHWADINIYPAASFAAIGSRAAADIEAVQKILANPNASYSRDDLPALPPPYIPMGVALAAQEKVISFKNGRGVRYLLELKSDVSPIINDLMYFFSGLTNDGKYYVTAEFGTSLPYLQNDPSSNAVPPGGVPFPTNLATPQGYDDYMKQITNLINSSSPDKFNPSLNSLDALIQSISINK